MDMTHELNDKPTIFVVDDTPDNLSLMSSLLKPLYRVKVANSGERALAYLENNDVPDLILLDIMMPGLSGYDVLSQLKSTTKTRDIPVLFQFLNQEFRVLQEHLLQVSNGTFSFLKRPLLH